MGNLLSIFKSGSSQNGESSASGNFLYGQTSLSSQFPKAALSLECEIDYDTTDELSQKLIACLERSEDCLSKLKNYTGSSNYIRTAITTPTPENEELAWKSLSPMITLLRDCFVLSHDIESLIPGTLEVLLSDDDDDSDLRMNVAILFAKLIDYSFEFDNTKMGLSDIQNDLSFYRRILPRVKNSLKDENNDLLSSEVTNQMSLFYAYHNPMIKTFVDKVNNKNDFLEQLLILAAGVGVFSQKSKLPILQVISLIKKNVPNKEAEKAYLLSIQLGSKHFYDKDMNPSVKKAFGAEQ
ncbi:hypothetical protein BB560_005288 [Smittium megazygosporum]|uniref:CYRIA/CYRIB Rac1 binding domain-containing protein n=1 Tax=Smittium megazygosporum TaxID=133381 RepID=A0A2T9Z6W8_9FUNG|nr:hypothetical protein BB560_005288 [Smittium megazygosporum]